MAEVKATYEIEYTNDGCIRILKSGTTKLVYKIPYDVLKQWNQSECNSVVENRFIVYILYKYNRKGKDFIYVGKSKNGISLRPKQHENKFIPEICYVLTDDPKYTFFNDGIIQYLENQIKQKVDSTSAFIDTTNETTPETANKRDVEKCEDYLHDAYMMLQILGLDLDRVYNDAEQDTSTEVERRNPLKKPILSDKEREMKLTLLVPLAMKKLEEAQYVFSDEQMNKMLNAEYNKELFGKKIKWPFMKLYNPEDPKCAYCGKYIRFRKEPYLFNGRQYLVSKEWFDTKSQREGFLKWYDSL